MARLLFLTLPALAAAIVAWTVLGGAAERIRYVQVLGGPTRESSTLSLMLRAFEQRGDDRPLPLSGLSLQALARAGGSSANAAGTTDATGQIEIRLELGAVPGEDPWLRVEETLAGAAQRLAEGPLALDVERWRADARREGGWLRGQLRGELRVRVAAESGVFAVPFASHLIVQVLEPRVEGEATDGEPGSALPGAIAHVELDGAELVADSGADARPAPAPPGSARLATDRLGQTRIALRPIEHAVNARVVARAGERHGEWYGVLPVVPGAMIAALSGSSLAVRSPIARGRAFLSLVSTRQRLAGAIVPLEVGADGSAFGHVELGPQLAARLEAEASWVVVSSEYDKRSPGAVGWPLHPAFDVTAPRSTFSVPDQVLLDGRNGALYDRARRERTRRRSAATALLAVGALMAAAFWIEVRRGRVHAARRATTGDGSDEGLPLSPEGWVLGVALACIVLGLGALAYFGWLAR